MRVRRGSRRTFGAGHLMPSILALCWFKIGYITVLILGMIRSSWLHLGRPDMKHYPMTRMWRLVTSPARYELFISPGQVSRRAFFFFFFFKVDLAFNPFSARIKEGVSYTGSNLWICGRNPEVWPFKWNYSSSTFTFAIYFTAFYQNKILNFLQISLWSLSAVKGLNQPWASHPCSP